MSPPAAGDRRARRGALVGAGALAAAGALLALAGGCGSSQQPAATSSGGGQASGAPAEQGTGTQTSRSSLKVTGTPKYAPPGSGPVQSGSVSIAYREISIHPDVVRVKAGTTVTWTNYDPVEHNVTSSGGPQRLASGNFAEGKSFSVRLTRPGIIHYVCTIHPASMNGTIEVLR